MFYIFTNDPPVALRAPASLTQGGLMAEHHTFINPYDLLTPTSFQGAHRLASRKPRESGTKLIYIVALHMAAWRFLTKRHCRANGRTSRPGRLYSKIGGGIHKIFLCVSAHSHSEMQVAAA